MSWTAEVLAKKFPIFLGKKCKCFENKASLSHCSIARLVSLRFQGITVTVVFGPQALAAFCRDHCKPGIMPLPHFSCKMPASPVAGILPLDD